MLFFQYVTDFLLLFAMVNVLGNLPVIQTVVAPFRRRERDKKFNIATGIGGLIAAFTALVLEFLLGKGLGLNTELFRMMLWGWLFLVALWSMIRRSNLIFVSRFRCREVAYFPLSFPVLAGPGTIAAIILMIQTRGLLYTAILVFLVYLAVLPLLQLVPRMVHPPVKTWTGVIARMLYLMVMLKALYLSFGKGLAME